MEIQSPIQSLMQVLDRVQLSALTFQSKLEKNEATTRAALIDPVLCALGWDTANPGMVEFEMFYANTKVDYALYDCAGKLQVIVEAKALGANLSDIKTTSTIVSYCLVHGIPNVYLTDGLIWHHYNQFTPGGVTPRSFDLRQIPGVEFAQYMIQYLDAAIFWPQQRGPNILDERLISSRISTLESQYSALLAAQAPAPSAPAQDTQGLEPDTEWILLEDIHEDLKGKKPPRLLRLPDGSQVAIKKWRDILAASCRFVLVKNPQLSIPLPDRAGKKISIFTYTRPDKEVTIDEVEYNGKKVYIYLNYDSNNCVRNAAYLLKHFSIETTFSAAVTY